MVLGTKSVAPLSPVPAADLGMERWPGTSLPWVGRRGGTLFYLLFSSSGCVRVFKDRRVVPGPVSSGTSASGFLGRQSCFSPSWEWSGWQDKSLPMGDDQSTMDVPTLCLGSPGLERLCRGGGGHLSQSQGSQRSVQGSGGSSVSSSASCTPRMRNMKTAFLRIMENLLFGPNWSSLQGPESPRKL